MNATYWDKKTFKEMLSHTSPRTASLLVQGAGKDCLGRGGPLDLWMALKREEKEFNRAYILRDRKVRERLGIVRVILSEDTDTGATGWRKYALVRAETIEEARLNITSYLGGYYRHPEFDCQAWADAWACDGSAGNGLYLMVQTGGYGG